MGKIKHSGRIEGIYDDKLTVRILQMSACAACHAKGHCGAADKKEKIVDVYDFDRTAKWQEGQEVDVVASDKVGMQAVIYAFSLPFIVLVAVLFIVMKITGSEVTAALASLGSLVVYYLILYMLRGKLREKLTFKIESAETT